MSSGIHYNKPLVFHWCDQLEMNGAALSAHAPRKLSKAVEYFSIFVSFTFEKWHLYKNKIIHFVIVTLTDNMYVCVCV